MARSQATPTRDRGHARRWFGPALFILFATAVPGPAPRAQPASKTSTVASEGAGASTGSGARTAAPATFASPAPQPGALDVERQHIARYDAAIAAVRDQTVSPQDAAKLQAAFHRLAANDAAGARANQAEIGDPLAAKLVDWFRLRAGLGDARETARFIAANPDWASHDLLVRRRDEAILTEIGNAQQIRELIGKELPQTGAGLAALAVAALADGDETGATRLARTAWRDYDIGAKIEAVVLSKLGRLLTPADHKWRFDRLLMDDPRWVADRHERAAQARRMVPLLGEGEKAKAEARLAVFLHAGDAGAKLAALPADDGDWGLQFQRIQSYRRAKQIEAAAQLMRSAPTDPAKIVSPDGWWPERRTLFYALLNGGNPKLAYEMVKAAGPLTVNPLKDQAFHAGFVALRFLGEPALAASHFEAMKKAADGPLSAAKSAYWLGRALEAQGKTAAAREQYTQAARYFDTFHGQLARAKLDPQRGAIRLEPPKAPTKAEIDRFTALEPARAAVIARKAGLDPSISRMFVMQLQRWATSEAELGMVAHLADALGDTQGAVRIGKTGIAKGWNLILFAYPLHAFPAFNPLSKPPEQALLLAIARQETEFHSQTLSGAGARGILQVMPVTAQHVCKDYKLKCDIPRLMTDNAYNTMMAAAYIGDRMRELGGSYVLGIAGYNAGPGRARQWARELGDPRDAKVDVIDWIHRIPFEETREYVQKVLSNLQIYRARLAAAPARLAIADDLARSRSGSERPSP